MHLLTKYLSLAINIIAVFACAGLQFIPLCIILKTSSCHGKYTDMYKDFAKMQLEKKFVSFFCGFADSTAGESQRKTSCNGELNGLLGTDLIGAGVRSPMMETSTHSSDSMNMGIPQTM